MALKAERAAVFALALLATAALPPQVRAERLPVRFYTTDNGLAHDRVHRIVRDSKGFLWFCTAEGLSRFDGVSFKNFFVADGLPYPSVNDIVEVGDGSYWIATNGGGISHFDASGRTGVGTERFVSVTVADYAAANRVNVLYQDTAGRLWAGTDGGLFRLDQPTVARVFQAVRLGMTAVGDRRTQVWAIEQDTAGTIWIGTSSGLFRFSGAQEGIRYAMVDADRVYSVLEDRNRRIWIAYDGGVSVFNKDVGRVSANTVRFDIPNARIERGARLHEGADGRLWIAAHNKLIEIGSDIQEHTAENGLAGHISTVMTDVDGNLWIGTLSSGAARIARRGFISYDASDGLTGVRIGSILGTRAGGLCVISPRQLFGCFDGQRFRIVRPRLPQQNAARAFSVALQDRLGEWWVPAGDGLFRFPTTDDVERLGMITRHRKYTERDGLAGADIWRMFEDSRGDIWIGTRVPYRDVLTRWQRSSGTFRRYSDQEGLRPFNPAFSFAEDRAGNIWVSFWDGGLAKYRDDRFEWMKWAPRQRINDLHVDRSGRLWLAAVGGLLRVENPAASQPSIRAYTLGDGLSSDSIRCLTEDEAGRIYLGTARGVDRLDPATHGFTHFGRAEGLRELETHAAFRDRAGDLWFASIHGLSRLQPEPDRRSGTPQALIEALFVNGRPYRRFDLGLSELGGLTFGSDQTAIRIDFFALSFTAGETVRYQYQLVGSDAGWRDPTEHRTVNYAKLSSGTYRFVVRAVSSDGAIDTAPASVTFTILPPLWARWWFLSLLAFVGIAAAYILHRRRLSTVVELERVRTRIATDLHDDIGATLSQISVLSEVLLMRARRDDPAAAETLSRITDASRESMDAMSDIVWAISPQRDSFTDLVQRMRRFAAETLTARNIAFSFEVPTNIPERRLGSEVRRELLLMFKEAVNNLVRHSGCSRADITCSVEDDRVMLSVRDDGCGLPPAWSARGVGMTSMCERATRLHGSCDIASAPGRGTTITFRVPIQGRRLAHGTT